MPIEDTYKALSVVRGSGWVGNNYKAKKLSESSAQFLSGNVPIFSPQKEGKVEIWDGNLEAFGYHVPQTLKYIAG